MDTKRIKFNMELSPRSTDSLKALFPGIKCSKYELPALIMPEDTEFPARIDISEDMVLIGIFCEETPLVLTGKLESNSFHCRSIERGSLEGGRGITAFFAYHSGEELFRVAPELRKRLDMWYEYIEIMLKKSRENTYLFRYEETVSRSGELLCLRVSGGREGNLRNMNVGTADENGEPIFSFGKAERYENGVLAVRTDKNSGLSMAEGRTRIAVYDAAALITCKRMKSGLDKLCRGEAVNKGLSSFLFNPSAANREKGDNITLAPENLLMKNMNTEQLAAVEGVLNAGDLYLIQGPPGTGKTTVIAEICYQNAIRGLKTLVVSQSNLAVDNAISRVMNHSEIRVLRKGDASRVEDEGLPFVEDNVVRTWIKCVSESAGRMAEEIDSKIETLKKYRAKLPEILRYAEDVRRNAANRSRLKSQAFFCKNVLEEADDKREQFLEIIGSAYDLEDPSKAYAAREFYPPDFRIPNNIYNDISESCADIQADKEKVRELEAELDMLGGYTARFARQMRFISRHVSANRMENTAYEGVFHYIDSAIADSLYNEGEKIIASIPYGLKSLIFRPKWGRAAAIYYRRAESFVYGIQRRTVRIAAKINSIITNEEYVRNAETLRLSLDALCQDYDAQYYTIKNKYDNMLDRLDSADKDYEYSVLLFGEKISDKFFSAALPGVSPEETPPDEIERLVNEYYKGRVERYIKWQGLLREWRRAINSRDLDYNSLKQLYIDNANVIGITCIQSGTADFEKNYPSFDVVIIDESSKSTPPDIILPMLKGRKIVLVGDHKQLPPYIDSDAYDELGETDEMLHELMKVSLFEELYESAPADMRTMLFRQYRMHRDIAALINQFYIDTDAGRLESPSENPKNHCCEGEDISEDNHVLWYDVKNQPEFYETRHDKSYCNNFEAECIRNILGMLDGNLASNGSRKTVGVITFYDAQVRLLEDMLLKSGFADTLNSLELRTGTVDRFQGMEEDIIIISFVRNNGSHNIGFAKDCRRINVALSRARELLIIVGSSENFIGSPDRSASAMFGQIKSITDRLGGMRDPLALSRVTFIPPAKRKYTAAQNTYYNNVREDESERDDSDRMNVLDNFILRAACEFEGTRLTVRSISGVLGISPVFVRSRVSFLVSHGYISCDGGVIRYLRKNEGFV